MLTMTLEQLRAVSKVGGVTDVTLKGQGGAFLVQISTRSGSDAVLAKTRSSEPRRFSNLAAALNVLRIAGITIGRFDASEWAPAAREPVARSSDGRAQALRKAHEAAAYNSWIADEIQAAIDDPRPSTPHDDVMPRTVRPKRWRSAGHYAIRPCCSRSIPTEAQAYGADVPLTLSSPTA